MIRDFQTYSKKSFTIKNINLIYEKTTTLALFFLEKIFLIVI